MDGPIEPRSGHDADGKTELDPPPNDMQNLFTGLDNGFGKVMVELSQIRHDMTNLPLQTAEALSGQLQTLSLGNTNDKGQTVASEVADAFVTKNQELEKEKTFLEGQIQLAGRDISSRAVKETDLRNEIFELKRQVARLEQKEVEFRDIILRNVNTQKITDQDVIHAFSDLRQSVQQLAKSSAFDLTSIPPPPIPDAKKQKMRHFYSTLRGLPLKDVSLRLRAQIFKLLYRSILSKTIFGLKRRTCKGGLNEEYWEVEESFERFQSILLQDPKVNENTVADWRISTLQCIGMLNLPEEYSIHVAEDMDEFLTPLARKATNPQKEELWNKIVKICKKAVDLKSMIQRSKEGYTIQAFDVKQNPFYSKLEHYADSMGVENGKTPDASDEIAYVLFGALSKHTKQMGGDWKTLVKAEVILKKKVKR